MDFLELQKKRYKVISRVLKRLYPNPPFPLYFETPFQALVVILLSAQSTDKKVNEISPSLFSKFPDSKSLAKAPLKAIEKIISSVNYYKSKAKNIKRIAQIIEEKYQGELPDSLEELTALPGVGRKTANAFLWAVFHKAEGIVVDTHVARLSKVYGITQEKIPEKIEKDLMRIIPKKEWGPFPLRMIYYGREFCPARKHDHHNCPLYKALKKENLL